MRVLMTSDAVGNVFAYTVTLARELSRRGVEVHLATMGPVMRAEQRALLASIPGAVLHESIYALEWMDEPWADVARAADWLRVLEREVRADIIHLNGYVHASLPFEAPVVIAAHSCVLSWWRAVQGEAAPERYATYRRAVARGLEAAAAVIAPSRAMLTALESHYGALANGFVVYSGTPDVALGVVEKEPFILSSGRIWDRAKNLDAVVRAAPHLRWPVRLAGSEPSGGDATSHPNLHMLGILSAAALAEQMARAAVFALPSMYEPFGLTALEAAVHACALVLGDIDSLREVWGGDALFVPPDDDAALVRALDVLCSDPVLRTDLGVRARQRAMRYGAARMAEETLSVYAIARSIGKSRVRRCA